MSSKGEDIEAGQPPDVLVPAKTRQNTFLRTLATLPSEMLSKSAVSSKIPRPMSLEDEKEPKVATMTRILRNTVLDNNIVEAGLIIARLKAEGAEEKSAGFTIQDQAGNGLLQIAALRNYVSMTRLLLDEGFDVNAVDSNHGTALQAAIYMNHSGIIKLLMDDENVDLNTKGGYYGCALQVAAFKGAEGLVKKLLLHTPKAADVNIHCGKYGSILQAAARTGLPSLVELILNSGFLDVNVKGGVYGTALQAAAKGGYHGDNTLLLQLSRGRVLRQTTNVPRQAAVKPCDYLTVAKKLLQRGAKVSICGGKRLGSPINAAASSGQYDILKLLLDTNDRSPLRRMRVALMSAITQTIVKDKLPLVKVLVEHGADFDFEAEGFLYNRPLTAAAALNSLSVVEYLLFKAKDKKEELMNVESGIFGSALRAALSASAKETSEYLIKQGADLRSGDQSYGNILHLATFSNLTEVVKLLLMKQVDVNILDENGQTALHVAVYRGHITIVAILLRSGAKFNQIDVWGDTPLDIVERRLENDTNPGPSLEDLRKIKQLLLDRECLERKPESDNSFHGPSIFKKSQASQLNRSRARSVFTSPKWNPGLGFEASIVDFLDNDGEEFVLVQSLPVDDLLYRNRAIEDLMKKGGSKETPNLRWIHLPANNMTWVEMLLKVLWTQKHKTTTCKSFWGIDPYFVSPDLALHARFVTPQCEKLITGSCDESIASILPKTNPENTLFVAMPYLHWEPYRAQEAVSKLLDEITEDSFKMRILRRGTLEDQAVPPRTPLSAISSTVDTFTDPNVIVKNGDDKLLTKYVFKRWPLHLRRTLDQYYYSYLADTKVRDADQVVMRIWNRDRKNEAEEAARYLQKLMLSAEEKTQNKSQARSTKQINGTSNAQRSNGGKIFEDSLPKDENSPIVMVDQLWLWVLSNDLIVTAFPKRRSDKAEGDLDPDDRTDVLKSLHAYLHSAKRHPIQDAYDLCELITSQSIGILHCSDMIPELDFLKIFAKQADSAIDQVMTKLTGFVDGYEKFMKWLNQKHRDPEEYVTNFENIFSVTDETTLLREIQDLKDELGMLAAVFEDQKVVLAKAGEVIKMDRQKKIETRSSAFNFWQQSQKHARHVERMRLQAKQAYDNLKDLLDLKQQQASVLEARVSRNQTLAAQEQSKTIMVFTIVTIIFLPLTFMVTVFTLPIIEFPRYDPANGALDSSGQLKAVYVFPITVAVTAALAIPLIITAFKIKRVESALESLRRFRWRIFPLHFIGSDKLEIKEGEPVPTWGPYAGFYWKGPLPKRGTNINDISE